MPKKNKKNKSALPAYNRKTLAKLVLTLLKSAPSEMFNYKQISKRFDIKDEGTRELVLTVLDDLKTQGKIEEVYTGKFKFLSSGMLYRGKVDMTAGGDGYVVVPDLEEDVFVSRQNLNCALHGDTVEIVIWARRKKQRPEGEVVEIIQRAKTDFVGILQLMRGVAYVEPTDRRMPVDIFIPQTELHGAQNGDKVLARITEWHSVSKNPNGSIVDVLGKPGDNNTEMHAILAEFDLPYKFPQHLNEIAEKIEPGITPEEIAQRRDFRNITTFTIDPFDAKDFDDALSFRKLENGLFEVGVHIADVTHYVKPETEIDNEALSRGTSVYLVDRTVPMLPERLSNFICSLRPNEEKLTYSAVFEINDTGHIKHTWFGRTVIRSIRRFTYEEAQEIIETGKGDLSEELAVLNNIARKLREDRFKNNSISFDKVEVKFKLDDTGKPLSVYFKEAKDSNKLIEEFMLLANKKVAEFVGRRKNETPKSFVYRIHDEPDMQKLYNFSGFIKQFGYKMKLGNEKEIAVSLNKLLLEVKGKPEQNVVEQLAVRSMAKAEYSTENVGHYGLAFEFYTHFTSPIRRYPDMMVHRLLDRYLKNGASVPQEALEQVCKQNSESEQQAATAERASIKYKQVEFMQNRLGAVFEGVISGVSERGLYVEISENKIEGMIAIRELDDDYYTYDDKNYCLNGQRKKRQYRLGDSIKIQIVRANLQKRQLDFVPA